MIPRDLRNIHTTRTSCKNTLPCENDTKTISVFLPAGVKTSWLPLPSLLPLISACTMQPENTYFFHSLQRGKYHPLFIINKPTCLPIMGFPIIFKNQRQKNSMNIIFPIFFSLSTTSQYIIL